MNNNFPSSREIEALQKRLRPEASFIRLVHTADLVNRYLQKRFGNQPEWIKANILIFLTISGGVAKPSKLAQLLLRSYIGLTKFIDSLEKDGLVTREHDIDDRRSTNIRITSAGLLRLGKILDYSKEAGKEIMDCLDENEKEVFRVLLVRIRKRLFDEGSKLMKKTNLSSRDYEKFV